MHKQILNPKSFTKNTDTIFWDVFNNIEKYVSKDHIESKIESTIAEIDIITKGKRSAYAWSGGKDSVVVGFLSKLCGINQSVIGLCDLEYPIFLEWLNKNSPSKIDVIKTKQDINWLLKNPDMLFPFDSKKASIWYRIVQQEAQRLYFKRKGLDILILGRRRAEGNYVGKKGKHLYSNKKGTTLYSPIHDWSHEEVLACMKYYQLPIAPFYSFTPSFYYGTHPWARRNRNQTDVINGTTIETWKEIYYIDKRVVEFGSNFFPEACEVLNAEN